MVKLALVSSGVHMKKCLKPPCLQEAFILGTGLDRLGLLCVKWLMRYDCPRWGR